MSASNTTHTEQHILNESFDSVTGVLAVEQIEFDPAGVTKRKVTDNLASRIAAVGTITYIGKATIGSATSSAVWQIKKIDETSGVSITWADGNDSFDGVWDDYLSLSYV